MVQLLGNTAIAAYIFEELAAAADPVKAPQMQAYMKTEQPFWGVQKPRRAEIMRQAKKAHPVQAADELHAAVAELWRGEKREEQYMAIDLAAGYRRLLSPASMPLLEEMLQESSNWDLIDAIVCGIVSPLILKYPELYKYPAAWLASGNFWMRRSSLLCHIKHKQQTDTEMLAATIGELMHEKEFFIRKAIGWILREYGKSNPDWVRAFVAAHADELSGLSKREALRRL